MSGRRLDVRGRVALVTGAGQGIGLALGRRLHARGAEVALLDVNRSAVEDAARSLGAERAHAIAVDVRNRAAMAAAVGATVERFGGLDVVVANAGVVPRPSTLRTLDPEEYDRVVAINQTGVFNTVRPAIDPVIERAGHIVIVSSVAAFVPGIGGASYMVSKAAVEQLGRALRLELAPHGASAGVAYFGIVDTEMVHETLDEGLGKQATELLPKPLRRRITADEAAETIAGGIDRRAARTLAPRSWAPWLALRGLLDVAVDARVARHAQTHGMIRELERQARPGPTTPARAGAPSARPGR